MKKIVLALCIIGACPLQSKDQLPQEDRQVKAISSVAEFDFSQFEFDETDDVQMLMEQESKPPSQFEIYARQIGVALLFKYLDAKEYCSSWWDYLKKLFTGNFKIEWS